MENKGEKPSSRKIDALVAEHVMGLEMAGPDCPESFLQSYGSKCRGALPVPYYSTDVAVAWEIVEKLRHDYGDLQIDLDRSGANSIEIYEPEIVVNNFHSFPRMVCEAALKAKGVSVE